MTYPLLGMPMEISCSVVTCISLVEKSKKSETHRFLVSVISKTQREYCDPLLYKKNYCLTFMHTIMKSLQGMKKTAFRGGGKLQSE